VTGSRPLSQAISEGDGISVVVYVADGDGARHAEAEGAEGVALREPAAGIREATGLPILVRANGPGALEAARHAGADACLLIVESHENDFERLEELFAEAHELGLECVVDVHDEDELELALDRLDPEIFLLSPRGADDDEEPLDRVLELLPDVPAGKLAIAELPVTDREQVLALERAGVDAVLVETREVAELVGSGPPRV
jgi:indole-3-glycerol phosphate synthase